MPNYTQRNFVLGISERPGIWLGARPLTFPTLNLPFKPPLISIDLISSDLSGCEATQFAVAATIQNMLIGWLPVLAISQGTGFTVGFYVGSATYCALIGRSHGELSVFSLGEMKSAEMRLRDSPCVASRGSDLHEA